MRISTQVEEAFKIVAGAERDLLDADPFQFRELRGGLPHEGRFIAFAAMRQRREIWQSVSTSNLSIGTDRATSRKSRAFLNVNTPENDMWNPISMAASASLCVPVKQ